MEPRDWMKEYKSNEHQCIWCQSFLPEKHMQWNDGWECSDIALCIHRERINRPNFFALFNNASKDDWGGAKNW